MKPIELAPFLLFFFFAVAVAFLACATPGERAAEGPAGPQAPRRLAAAPTLASPPTPVRDTAVPADRRVILRAARVLDVRTGRIATDQAIAIQGDKIVRIAPSSQITAAAGTEVIDLRNQTVLPGLIDMHVHLTGDPKYAGWEHLGVSIPREALIGAKNARITLRAGFTTVRNLGANAYADVALRDAINDGEIDGPRIVASGLALGITGGHCDENMLTPDWHSSLPSGIADGPDEAVKKVREQIKFGADVIKICATGGVLSRGDDPRASQYSPEELRAIVNDAHRLGRRVAAHAHGGEGIRFAVEAGVDTIEHGTYIDDQAIAAMKARGTYLVPTLMPLSDAFFEAAEKNHLPPDILAKAHEVAAHGLAARSKAFKSGVRFAFGTDAAVYPHGENAKEFTWLVKLGMTPLQAIQSATINAADALGWSDKVGAIEPGKWADLIAVEGDPLKDVSALEHVKFVMKAGEVFSDERAEAPPRVPAHPRKDQMPLHIDSDEPKAPPAERM